MIFLGLVLAGRVRKLGCFSLPEIAGLFYGVEVRTLAAMLVLLAEVAWLGLLLKGCVVLLSPVVGLSSNLVLWTIGAVFILYTVVGGQFAVARTDVLQLALMAAGILLAAVLLLAGPLDWNNLPADRVGFPANRNYPCDSLLPLILVAALPHIVGSDIYGKLLSTRDESSARTSALAAGAIKIIFGIAAGIIGLAAVGLASSGQIPADTPGDFVLTQIITRILPAPIAALVIVAFLATLMSSADSVLLTASTVLSRDILSRRDERTGRIACAVLGLMGIVFAASFPSLLEIFFFAYTLFSAVLTLPILFGFWKSRLRLTTAGAAAAMGGGAVVVLATQISGWGVEQVIVGGLASSSILLFAVSLITHRRGSSK